MRGSFLNARNGAALFHQEEGEKMSGKDKQADLFDMDELLNWKEHWKDMPEFEQKDLMPHRQVIVSFRNDSDLKRFSSLIGQQITDKTKSLWFPEEKIRVMKNKRWVDES